MTPPGASEASTGPADQTGALRAFGRTPLYRFVAKACDMASQLGCTVIAARYLGVEGYGEYALVVSLVMVLWPVVDMGLDHVLIREVASRRRSLRDGAGDVLAVRLFLVLLSVPLLAIGARLLGLTGQPLIAAWLFGLAILVARQVVQVSGRSTPLLKGRVRLEAVLSATFGALKVGAVALVVLFDLGFLALFAAALLGESLHAAGALVVAARCAAVPRVRWRPATWRPLLADGYPIGLSVLLVTCYFHVDSFVIKAYWSTEELGVFAAPYRLVGALTLLAVTVLWVFLPLFSRLSVERPGVEMEAGSGLARLTLLVGGIGAAAAGGLAAWAVPAVYGQSFRHPGSLATLQVLAPLLILRPLGYVSDLILVARRRQVLVCAATGVGLTVNLIGDLVFVPRLGAVGAAIGTLAGDALYLATTMGFSRAVCGRSLLRLKSALPAAACAVLFGGAVRGSWAMLAAGAGLYVVVVSVLRKQLVRDAMALTLSGVASN